MTRGPLPDRPAVDHSIGWLVGIAVACLLAVLGLKVVFDSLQEELRESSANERARLFVGEEIVRGIHGIETDLYLMASSSNPAAVIRVNRAIGQKLEKLRHDLSVLKTGGTVRRQVQLNLEGRDEMVREASYQPSSGETGHVMELIEIAPLLDQIQERSRALEQLLVRGWAYQERGDRTAFFAWHDEVDAFLKHLPPYFARLDENANRLFFDSSARLRDLEGRLAGQREMLKRIEMGVVGAVILFAGLVSLIYVRRINQAQQQLADALHQMQLAKEIAERASRAKSEFVSRMSHELRTPLNAIIGFAQLLEAEPLPPSQKNYVGLITSSGNHLMELINAVLDHAKIEAGGMSLERITFDFHATVEDVRRIVLERASEKGLGFVADIASDLPRYIVGDPTRLRQVLINLLVNGIKFTERGSVELRIAVDDGRLVFSIRDSGIGMDHAALSRLFQPFAQADETISRKYGGTGLGLLISKELVEAMGGSIEVDSAPGVGTCFWIRLPLQVADTQVPVAGADTPADDGELAAVIGGRVLLVDDNRVNQQLGMAILERMRIPGDIASNGHEALERLAGERYALVLMDMEMPEMDGLTATRLLRQREADGGLGHLPVIAMTANALAEDRQRCFEAGMDGYVSKPVSLLALAAEVRRLFGAPPGGNAHPGAVAGGALAPDATGAGAGAAPSGTVTTAAAAKPDAVFDHARVMDNLGDEDLFRELAALYVADAPGYVTALDAALAQEDWPALAREAHTLKGLLVTFAAHCGDGDARRLELAALATDVAACASLLPTVREQATQLAAALAQAISP